MKRMSKTLLTAKDKKLLLETKRLMEEVLETEEILADRELMTSIRRSLEDVKAGRVTSLEQLRRELKSRGKL